MLSPRIRKLLSATLIVILTVVLGSTWVVYAEYRTIALPWGATGSANTWTYVDSFGGTNARTYTASSSQVLTPTISTPRYAHGMLLTMYTGWIDKSRVRSTHSTSNPMM
jgi:hypothetical protein